VRQELAGLPVAGLVMVTDGADTADTALNDALQQTSTLAEARAVLAPLRGPVAAAA